MNVTNSMPRTSRLDWPTIATDLDERGWAHIPTFLSSDACDDVATMYDEPTDTTFRNRVVMQRHGFGRGEYRYFAYPLPALVEDVRSSLYPHLAPIANAWNERMSLAARFPSTHAAFLERCHRANQTRPTPLLLTYGPGDYNCLHQDLYGEHAFPMQVATLLSEPDVDFTGGEFVVTEQRPRMQSRAFVVPLRKGDAVIFAVDRRPQRGVRGDYRVVMRHGVSPVRTGTRRTLGVIFHDAS